MDWALERKNLVKELKLEGIKDEKVLAAIAKTPRHLFVPEREIRDAYRNIALPVGYGQTISQPYTIAVMLQALELKKGDKVLEVGTASGYNASLIAEIVGKKGKVFTTEIVPELAKFANDNLKKNNIKNVKVVQTDGSQGYEKEAPYDAIIVTAASPRIPQPLSDQIKDKRIMVMPVGSLYEQEMLKIRKVGKEFEIKKLGFFIFVPLKGEYGWP